MNKIEMRILLITKAFFVSFFAFNQSDDFIEYSAEMNGRYAHEYEEAMINEVVLKSSNLDNVEFVFERSLSYRDVDGVGTERFTANVYFEDELGYYSFSTDDKEIFGYCGFEAEVDGELMFVYTIDDGNNYEEKFFFEGDIDVLGKGENSMDNSEKELPNYIEEINWYDETAVHCFKNDNDDILRVKEIENVFVAYLEKEVVGDGYHYLSMHYFEAESKNFGANKVNEWIVVEGYAEYSNNELFIKQDNTIEFDGESYKSTKCK